MNILKTLKKFTVFILIASTTFFVSCDDDFDKLLPGPTLTVVETAQATNELSILVDAIVQADLVSELTVYGAKTILAPTNDAFTAFLTEKGFTSLSDVPNDVLKQILLYHVIDGANITAANFTEEDENYFRTTMATTSTGTNIDINFDATSGSVVFNESASVIQADIITKNGIVHIVDKVIDIPN